MQLKGWVNESDYKKKKGEVQTAWPVSAFFSDAAVLSSDAAYLRDGSL